MRVLTTGDIMTLIDAKSLRVCLLLPTYGEYSDDFPFFGRQGKRLQLDSGFTYLKACDDVGSWFGFSLLGFGLGFYWNFTEETW